MGTRSLEKKIGGGGQQHTWVPSPPRQGFGAKAGGVAQGSSRSARALRIWWPQPAAITGPVSLPELGQGVSRQLRKS